MITAGNLRRPTGGIAILKSRLGALLLALGGSLALPMTGYCAENSSPTIILVGSDSRALDDEHDWADTVITLERMIKASPEFSELHPVLKSYPTGFPSDLASLDDAKVIVLYTGLSNGANSIEKPEVQAKLGELMKRGVGLVSLHEAFTVRDTGRSPLIDWLGGVRASGSAISQEVAPLAVAAKHHPIANGISDFAYLDGFAAGIEFRKAPGNTPILTARLHTQYEGGSPVFKEPSEQKTVAWAHERTGGGRAFAFAGLHFLDALEQLQVRKLLLNAIMWTAGEDVPQSGVSTNLPVPDRILVTSHEAEQVPVPWGNLVWFASRSLNNSSSMTVGEATVNVGMENPPHWHPNTDEILHVVQGHIMHRVGDQEYEMREGDTVSIPAGTIHNARNLGNEEAILFISFNNTDRFTVGE